MSAGADPMLRRLTVASPVVIDKRGARDHPGTDMGYLLIPFPIALSRCSRLLSGVFPVQLLLPGAFIVRPDLVLDAAAR